MELIFLGAGSGINVSLDNFQSNMLLRNEQGKILLVDCGTDFRFSLKKAGFGADDIDAVYISHLHADHIGGLEWFALQRKYVSTRKKPTLFLHESLVGPLWEQSLKGGLNTLMHKEASLADYFQVQVVPESTHWEWEGVSLQLMKTVHIYANEHLLPSYGLFIEKKYLISTDTQIDLNHLHPFYKTSLLIFHDCETYSKPSGVHSNYQVLKQLPLTMKNKMWLYHYNDGVLPDAGAEGFLGFVVPQQRFVLA